MPSSGLHEAKVKPKRTKNGSKPQVRTPGGRLSPIMRTTDNEETSILTEENAVESSSMFDLDTSKSLNMSEDRTWAMLALQDLYKVAKARSAELSSSTQNSGSQSNGSLLLATKLHTQLASRMYAAISCVLYATIGCMQSAEMENIIRRNCAQLPAQLLDSREWLAVLRLAQKCRDACCSTTTELELELSVFKPASAQSSYFPDSSVTGPVQGLIASRIKDHAAFSKRSAAAVLNELATMKATVQSDCQSIQMAMSGFVREISRIESLRVAGESAHKSYRETSQEEASAQLQALEIKHAISLQKLEERFLAREASRLDQQGANATLPDLTSEQPPPPSAEITTMRDELEQAYSLSQQQQRSIELLTARLNDANAAVADLKMSAVQNQAVISGSQNDALLELVQLREQVASLTAALSAAQHDAIRPSVSATPIVEYVEHQHSSTGLGADVEHALRSQIQRSEEAIKELETQVQELHKALESNTIAASIAAEVADRGEPKRAIVVAGTTEERNTRERLEEQIADMRVVLEGMKVDLRVQIDECVRLREISARSEAELARFKAQLTETNEQLSAPATRPGRTQGSPDASEMSTALRSDPIKQDLALTLLQNELQAASAASAEVLSSAQSNWSQKETLLQTQIQSYTHALATQKTKLASLEDALVVTKSECGAALAALEDATNMIGELRTQVSGLNSQERSLKQELDRSKDELAKLSSNAATRMSVVEEQTAALQQQLRLAEGERYKALLSMESEAPPLNAQPCPSLEPTAQLEAQSVAQVEAMNATAARIAYLEAQLGALSQQLQQAQVHSQTETLSRENEARLHADSLKLWGSERLSLENKVATLLNQLSDASSSTAAAQSRNSAQPLSESVTGVDSPSTGTDVATVIETTSKVTHQSVRAKLGMLSNERVGRGGGHHPLTVHGIVLVQAHVRGIIARHNVRRAIAVASDSANASSASLVAVHGTRQGETGWYVRQGHFFYFCLEGEEYLLMCGPITEDMYRLACSDAAEMLNRSTSPQAAQRGRSSQSSGGGSRPVSQAGSNYSGSEDRLHRKIYCDRIALSATRVQIDALLGDAKDREAQLSIVRKALDNYRSQVKKDMQTLQAKLQQESMMKQEEDADVIDALKRSLEVTRNELLVAEKSLKAVPKAKGLTTPTLTSLTDQTAPPTLLKLQALVRGWIGRRKVHRVVRTMQAMRSGVLVAMPTTTQGESGWYAGPTGDIFYFIHDQQVSYISLRIRCVGSI